MMRENEPSSSTNKPPTFYFNEGGKKCFSNTSIWQELKNSQENVNSIEDFFQMGGATAKSLLSFDNLEYKAIWKPQLKEGGGHKDSSFFEVVYFHLDCLLNLRKTPPAVSFSVQFSPLYYSLSEASINFYEDRKTDWQNLRKNNIVPGVAQFFVNNLKHENVLVEKFGKKIRRFFNYFFGIGNFITGRNDFALREYSQRDMIDYIAGNWDRGHNRFYTIDPITHDTVLVYIDHNHFKLDKKQTPFSLEKINCKFWYHDIFRIKKLLKIGIENLLRKSLKKEELIELGLDGRFDNPLKRIDHRANDFLEYVDHCVDQFGFEDVFGFPIEESDLHKKLLIDDHDLDY